MMMSEKEMEAVRRLLDVLIDFYDDSDLQPPIKVGDERHQCICRYRDALAGRQLPPGEAGLMRNMIRLSRSKVMEDRKRSQDAAEDWAELLLNKYPCLRDQESDLERSTYLGDGLVMIGDQRVLATKRQHTKALEFLVKRGKATFDQLVSAGVSNPSKAIKELCELDGGILAPYISRPGPSKRGYSVNIIDGREN